MFIIGVPMCLLMCLYVFFSRIVQVVPSFFLGGCFPGIKVLPRGVPVVFSKFPRFSNMFFLELAVVFPRFVLGGVSQVSPRCAPGVSNVYLRCFQSFSQVFP